MLFSLNNTFTERLKLDSISIHKYHRQEKRKKKLLNSFIPSHPLQSFSNNLLVKWWLLGLLLRLWLLLLWLCLLNTTHDPSGLHYAQVLVPSSRQGTHHVRRGLWHHHIALVVVREQTDVVEGEQKMHAEQINQMLESYCRMPIIRSTN